MNIDEGIIIHIVLGCLFKVIQFFLQQLIHLAVLVHDSSKEDYNYYH
jgi:hypothetical protein